MVLCASMVTTPVSAGWFDAATGKPVRTIPIASGVGDPLANVHQGDHAMVGGKNLYYDKECGTWRDAKTGKEVRTIPIASGLGDPLANVHQGDHATVGNKTLFWKPCPPPEEAPAPPVKARPHVSFGFGIGTDDNSDDGMDRPRPIISIGK